MNSDLRRILNTKPAVVAAAMRFRLARPTDLPHCVGLLPKGFRCRPVVRQALAKIWNRFLESQSRSFAVIEDIERPYPANIEGFGLSIFVSDRFADEFSSPPRPYLAARCYERILAGEDIVLTPEQLRVANATSGLNVLVLHFGLRNHDLSDPRTAQVLAAGSAAFYFFHYGYNIRALFNEVHGLQAAQYMEQGGFRLVRNFHQESPGDLTKLTPQEYPYFYVLRREWVTPGAVNPLSQLFIAPPPRIHFSASERRVLEGALLNESDAQIAARLDISLDAVKKVWRNTYNRTQARVPNLIPEADRESLNGRGQEKRRFLLEYLRMHLEELRPSRHPLISRQRWT